MLIRGNNLKQHGRTLVGAARRVLTVALVLAVSLALGLATPSVAVAATPGIQIDVLHNGAVVGDGAVIPEGDGVTLRVQYDAAEDIAGTQIVITLPGDITVAGTLPNNDAIDSVVQNADGTLTVTFKDPIPETISEGAFALTLTAGLVEGTTQSPIAWKIGDDEGGTALVIEDQVIPPVLVTDGYNKAVNPNNLDGYVATSGSPDYQFQGLRPEIADQVLTYTLVLSSAEARSGYAITDELASGLGFVTDSFAAELTTAEGTSAFAFDPTVSGNSFAGAVDVPAQSTLRLTYEVRVTDTPALEALLRTQFEARGDTPGNYEILLPNDAVFGGEHERSVNVRVRGNIPGVGIGENFAKTGSWSLRDVVADGDGTVMPPADMVYTFRANLTGWTGENPNFTLDRNVVIRDALIDQASWTTGSDFISVSGAGPLTALSEAAGFSGTVAEFASDQYVGRYAVVGQVLLVNVGKDNATDVRIDVKAQLNSVQGLTGSDDTTVVDGTHYPWNNRAQFYYHDGEPANRDHNAGVVALPDGYEGGVNDSAAFSKTASDPEVRANPGESAAVPYRFEIDTSKPNIDPLASRVVDELNTEVFDVSDPGAIPVSGAYGTQALTREHFALSIEDDTVIIELSAAGKAIVGTLPVGQKWIIDVVFSTIPFDGKQTFEIYNRATLHSEGAEWVYWSEERSEATSFGDEAELRKRLFDQVSSGWVADLDAPIAGGEFVNDRFVYSIELIPRGNYGEEFPVTIFTREDVLPDAIEFVGFVELDSSGIPNQPVGPGPVEMNGNVVASYADGVVTIRQKDGTSLNPGQQRIVAYFEVQANDASQPIVNTIAGSEATILPVGDPSIDIEKWNDEGDQPQYNDAGALLNDGFEGDHDEAPGKLLAEGASLPIHFTVSNDGREDLMDIVVTDQLVEGKGAITDLSCTFPDESTGSEWVGPFAVGTQFECSANLPGLAPGDTHADMAQVSGVGVATGESVQDQDAWHAHVPHPSNGGGILSNTGAGSVLQLAGAALALMLAGSVALLVRRGRKPTSI